MYSDKKILAIIPARGGSKGLSGKNIKPLLGKPLIGWTIDQAKESKYIDEIFISTDSQEIADIAEGYGISVPSLRPKELATDTSPSSEFILYTIDLLKKQEFFFDYIILLEPTSPLRDVADIDSAIEELIKTQDAESIVGVCKVEDKHPSFLVSINEKYLHPYLGVYETVRRQDLKELYFFEGSLYISKVESYIKRGQFYHEKCLAYIVPKYKSFEVDDKVDFFIVEHLMKLKLNNEL